MGLPGRSTFFCSSATWALRLATCTIGNHCHDGMTAASKAAESVTAVLCVTQGMSGGLAASNGHLPWLSHFIQAALLPAVPLAWGIAHAY